jgi:hypothetical protein
MPNWKFWLKEEGMRKRAFLAVASLLCIAPVVAVGDIIPGTGGTSDLFIPDATPTTGFGTVNAGDVIICGFSETCTGGSTTDWSAVLVFYNPANGPYVTDSSADATYALVFGTLDASPYNVADFEANYDTGVGGADGLSSNYQIIAESDALGDWSYGDYTGDSPQTVPEPTNLTLLGAVLIGLSFARRKFARRLTDRALRQV